VSLPDGVVMGEDDAGGVELPYSFHPGRRPRQRTGVAIAVRAQREHVGATPWLRRGSVRQR
jgi:hypothetical protein